MPLDVFNHAAEGPGQDADFISPVVGGHIDIQFSGCDPFRYGGNLLKRIGNSLVHGQRHCRADEDGSHANQKKYDQRFSRPLLGLREPLTGLFLFLLFQFEGDIANLVVTLLLLPETNCARSLALPPQNQADLLFACLLVGVPDRNKLLKAGHKFGVVFLGANKLLKFFVDIP